MPSMKSTRILVPIESTNETLQNRSKSLFSMLDKSQYNDSIIFEDLLHEIKLLVDDYIEAIQVQIKQPTIFLKREPSHIWNNIFSPETLSLWNANTDAQYILNAYAAASYCSSYMTKLDRSMTSAFKKICREHEKSKINAIEMIRTLGNIILNLQKMSAQQAVHIALSMPLNSSSRKCVFINTSPSNE